MTYAEIVSGLRLISKELDSNFKEAECYILLIMMLIMTMC